MFINTNFSLLESSCVEVYLYFEHPMGTTPSQAGDFEEHTELCLHEAVCCMYDIPPEMLQTAVHGFANERNIGRLGTRLNVLPFRLDPSAAFATVKLFSMEQDADALTLRCHGHGTLFSG
jgi:hypothetical protein